MDPKTKLERQRAAAAHMHAVLRRKGYNHRGLYWTPSEDRLCRRHRGNYDLLQQLMPHRSHAALLGRCKQLRLVRPSPPPWTGAKERLLERIYPSRPWSEVLAAFPERNKEAVMKRANDMGLKRDKQPLIKTGDELLDQLRSYCSVNRISRAYLDHVAGSKHYFRKTLWRFNKKIWADHNAIVPAIEALGGELTVRWADDC